MDETFSLSLTYWTRHDEAIALDFLTRASQVLENFTFISHVKGKGEDSLGGGGRVTAAKVEELIGQEKGLAKARESRLSGVWICGSPSIYQPFEDCI